jgi:hypothetical protein
MGGICGGSARLREICRRRNAVIQREKAIRRGRVPREVLPMSEVIPFPERSSKTIQEETAEFLALLERIRSSSSPPKEKEK